MASCGISNRGLGMGLGVVGTPNNMVIKRKFRWTLEWEDAKSYKLIAPESFVKLASRPNMVFEESVVNNGNSKYWIPGKSSWEQITVTYFDVRKDEGGALFMYWVAQQYQRESNEPLKIEPALATLRLYDGCGNLMENWLLEDAIVTSVSFGSLDYVSDEDVAEATIRYSRVYYENNCPPFPSQQQQNYAGAGLGLGPLVP